MKTIIVRFKKICSCSVEIEVEDTFKLEDYGRGDLEPMVRERADHWEDNDERKDSGIVIVKAKDEAAGENRDY